jgi:Cu-Zn family superoxide dismutase
VATKGNEAVRGSIRLAEARTSRGRKFLQVTADVAGLAPGSVHGLNIHELGSVSCSDRLCLNLGASYNPEGLPHGKPDALKKFGASASHYAGEGSRYWRHVGDLANVTADAAGEVHVSFEDPVVELTGEVSRGCTWQAGVCVSDDSDLC